jgi:hypothetical protein
LSHEYDGSDAGAKIIECRIFTDIVAFSQVIKLQIALI